LSLQAASSTDAQTKAAPDAAQDPSAAQPPATVGAGPETARADTIPAELTATDTTHTAQAAPPQAALPDTAEAASENAAPAEEAHRTTFADLHLSEDILRAISEKGYLHPTPIQEQAIPIVLQGRDVLGVAQTGTGKTAGFTLPMCEILSGSRARARMPRSLILEPTRELALQVAENFVQYGKYLKLNHALLIGGESMADQKEVLMRGVDVLIATPGRLIDLFERGGLLLSDTRILVIDEADRMLDMGFIPDVERIVSLLPANRQTMLFSATMAKEIRRLADAFLQNPKEIRTTAAASVATTITSGLVIVEEQDKRRALRRLIRDEQVQNALIFCNRKRDVDILYKSLQRHGFSVGALHGDMPQSARFATLEKFRANELHLLVCSDVAARGIDIGGLSHVFNFDVPHHSEDYVHRIGRTGRAGREGRAFTFATPDQAEAVAAIVKLTGKDIPQITIDGFETLAFSESSGESGRRGRGRGKNPKAKTPDAKQPQAAREKPREGRTTEPQAAQPQAAGPQAAGTQAPKPRGKAQAQPGAAPAEPARRSQSSEERRPPRGGTADRNERDRERDAGPSVVGFGDNVPAFMLIRRRGHGVESVDATDFVARDEGPSPFAGEDGES
jgi:superfamily II DNA/RNA helicase